MVRNYLLRLSYVLFFLLPIGTTILSFLPSLNVSKANEERFYPIVPSDPEEIAALLAGVESALRNPNTLKKSLPYLGHKQQVIYRVVSKDEILSDKVILAMPMHLRSIAKRHIAARQEFLRMNAGRLSKTLPAWQIIPPEPSENLLSYYRKAEEEYGIEWEVLAAVNLVESGMGRIDGVSIANAQGPMQFLPTTWAEEGIGEGDIKDPHDSIQAAARYLVRRGGLSDIRRGLWGYNNSDFYVRAIMLYASLLKEDPMSFIGLYHWQIYYNTIYGDILLPVGYKESKRINVQEYLMKKTARLSPDS